MQYDLRHAFAVPACSIARTTLRDEDLATPDDVMQMTGMSKDWVYEVFCNPHKGGVRPMKMGSAKNAPIRWYTWQVKAWIDARYREASSR